MKEIIDFLTVSAVVAASIFFALLIEPLLLEGVLVVVDKGMRRRAGIATQRHEHFVELQLNAVPVNSTGPEDRR